MLTVMFPGTDVGDVGCLALMMAACIASVSCSSWSPAGTTSTSSRWGCLRPDVLSGRLRVFFLSCASRFSWRCLATDISRSCQLLDEMAAKTAERVYRKVCKCCRSPYLCIVQWFGIWLNRGCVVFSI